MCIRRVEPKKNERTSGHPDRIGIQSGLNNVETTFSLTSTKSYKMFVVGNNDRYSLQNLEGMKRNGT